MTNQTPVIPDPADAGNGVKRESRIGIAVQLGLSLAATAAIGWLGTLNLSTLPGWLAGAATLAVSAVVGYLTAYKTKNPVRY